MMLYVGVNNFEVYRNPLRGCMYVLHVRCLRNMFISRPRFAFKEGVSNTCVRLRVAIKKLTFVHKIPGVFSATQYRRVAHSKACPAVVPYTYTGLADLVCLRCLVWVLSIFTGLHQPFFAGASPRLPALLYILYASYYILVLGRVVSPFGPGSFFGMLE